MDFGWFLTIPGMLITGGVLLLIIALIIFITTSGKKSKKEVGDNHAGSVNNSTNNSMEMPPLTNPQPGEISNQNPVNVSPEASVMPPPENINNIEQPSISVTADSNMNSIHPVENMIQQDTPTTTATPLPMEQAVTIDQPSINPQITQMEPTVSPVMDNQSPIKKEDTPVIETPTMITPEPTPTIDSLTTPNMPPIMDQPGNGTSDIIPVTDISTVPSANSTAPIVTPEVSPVESNTSPVVVSPVTPISQEPVNPTVVTNPTPVTPEVLSVTDTPVVQQPGPVPIYGGADPTVNNINDSQNNSHQIYGGANPLENAQVVPVQAQEVTPVNPAPAVVPSVEAVSTQTDTGISTTST
ncbi:MAG: hypothetical protein HFJ12_05620 [Bacilli bacterium]|nr:hypothetical protein [Bacilli bacterium]